MNTIENISSNNFGSALKVKSPINPKKYENIMKEIEADKFVSSAQNAEKTTESLSDSSGMNEILKFFKNLGIKWNLFQK